MIRRSGVRVPNARLATNVLFGFLEGVDRRDAEAYARAFARRSLKTAERCWYSVEPLWSGFLYEVHEGGPGRSFLPDLAREIDANPGGVALVPSGRRVFEVTVRNGRPVGALLPEGKSREVQTQMAVMLPMARVEGQAFGVMIPAWVAQGQLRFRTISATRRMKRLQTPVALPVALSAVGFAAGLGVLIAGTVAYYGSPHRVPQGRAVALDRMPHRQWEAVLGAVAATSYVTRLEYRDGQWTVETTSPPATPPDGAR